MIQCVDCGKRFEHKKSENSLKIEFSNPGTVFMKANVSKCPECGSSYADEDDAKEIFTKMEAEYNKANNKCKK